MQDAEIRVLHIIDSLGAGGKERQIVELLSGLALRHDVKSFAAVMSDERHFEIDKTHGETIPIIRRQKRDPGVFKRLYHLSLRLNANIIHSWNSMCSVYAGPVAKLCGTTFVNGFIRDAPPQLSLVDKNYLRGKLTIPFSDVVVSNSLAGLLSYGVPGSKGVCIYNGFNFERIQNLADAATLRRALGITTPYIVGMVASFTPKKDYATFVEMARRICNLRSDVTFVTVGAGKTLSQTRDSLSARYSERVRFLGLRKDVESVINLFTVGVLLTNSKIHGEGISNAITEYMALRKPVVATADGGTPELVVEGKTGYLVPSQDPEIVTNRVMRFLDDASLASTFGSAGRQRIQTAFSLDAMTNAYHNLYRRLAK